MDMRRKIAKEEKKEEEEEEKEDGTSFVVLSINLSIC